MRYLFVILFSQVFFGGCMDPNDQVAPVRYVKYFSENEKAFKPTLKHGHFVFEASYRPAELEAIIETPDISDSALNIIKKENENKAYFVCKIYHDSLNMIEYLKNTYNEKHDSIWGRLLFNLQNSFSLKVNNEVTPCSIYQIEQTGNISPAITFDLTFEMQTKEVKNDWELIFNDSIISKNNWRLVFDKNVIGKIPKIKFNKR